MLLDEIKEIVNNMTDDATDRRIDNRYYEASLLENYATKFKEVLVKYMLEEEDNHDNTQ